MDNNPPSVQSQIVNTSSPTQICPECKTENPAGNYFCSNCGKKLKEPPPSTTIGKQISLYIFAIFVPPFGIIPGIRYLRFGDDKAKTVGMIVIVLTMISFIVSTYYTFQFFNAFNTELTKQLAPIQGGY